MRGWDVDQFRQCTNFSLGIGLPHPHPNFSKYWATLQECTAKIDHFANKIFEYQNDQGCAHGSEDLKMIKDVPMVRGHRFPQLIFHHWATPSPPQSFEILGYFTGMYSKN